MASIPTSTPPTASTWTLRLKNGKTTVLLHVNPLHTFATIKTHLLHALTETGLKDADNRDVPLPSSPSEIQFGRAVNILDPNSGFTLGEWEQQDAADEDDEVEEDAGKKKGKGRPKKDAEVGTVAANVKDCLKGAGLRDGAVLAFRWTTEGDHEMGDGEADMWGVEIPHYEDSYGVENHGDVGGHKEFEG